MFICFSFLSDLRRKTFICDFTSLHLGDVYDKCDTVYPGVLAQAYETA